MISLYGTAGMNLRTNNTETTHLIDWTQPNTPQNIQLHETKIDILELNMRARTHNHQSHHPDTPQQGTPDWSQITPATLLLTFIIVAAYLFNSKRARIDRFNSLFTTNNG